MTPFRPATLVVALSLAFAAGLSRGADAPGTPTTSIPAAAMALASGIDRAGMDTAVRPQDSLFRAANGSWLKNTPIPPDKSSFGVAEVLADQADEQVKTIIEKLVSQPPPAGTVDAKIADFYSSYLDTADIDTAGLKPLAPFMAELDGVRNKKELVLLMGRWGAFVDVPLGVGVGPDARDPSIYSAGTAQAGLGLGDRDYYLKPDANFAKARAAYVEYMRRLLAGDGDTNAKRDASAVMALEKRIARIQWTQEALRDPVKGYNPMTLEALAARAPDFDWAGWAAASDLRDPAFLSIAQPSFTWALVKLIKDQPLDTWKAYMRVRLLDRLAQQLPADMREASFQFRGVALAGKSTDLPRWKRAVAATNDSLGEALGQVYVARYFPPAYKARTVELVDNLLKAYSTAIDGLAWMSPATKAEAHAKLAKYSVKVGYPDVWRDYSALEIRAADPVGNSVRAARFEAHRQAVRNGHKVDRTEWAMTPQTVNAYYDPTKNEIVFPAAILQPPYFDMKADDAANYGDIGATIGHEISHGFDDEGSQYDGDGKLRNWWTPEDRKAFEAVTSRLVAQYSAYEALPGVYVKGKLTLGENIADLSGLEIAFKAWKLSLGGKPAPVIDGLTGEQRFFYGYAQSWREKTRDKALLQQVTGDPHAPDEFRADGVAINIDAFHETFDTRPGDKMWVAPADRIRLW